MKTNKNLDLHCSNKTLIYFPFLADKGDIWGTMGDIPGEMGDIPEVEIPIEMESQILTPRCF